MTDAAEPGRYCPICGSRTDDPFCEKHGVRTLDVSKLQLVDVLAPGSVIAERYRVERKLGQGAMGAVYEATQLAMDRRVALKVLSSASISELELRRLHREAKAVSLLKHPNIVNVYDFGIDESLQIPFIVMQLVEGHTLRRLLEVEAPLTPTRVLGLTEQIARGLVAAHEAGIVHRDLKPDNIMVHVLADGEEHIYVLDFGIAKEINVGPSSRLQRLTASGMIVGTPRYMSPEQIEGRAAQPQSDLYSLGCIIFEMLTGNPPFAPDELSNLLAKHMWGARPSLPAEVAGERVPPPLAVLFEALLRPPVEERPASAAAVLAFLKAIRSGSEPPRASLFSQQEPAPRAPGPLPSPSVSGRGDTDTQPKLQKLDSGNEPPLTVPSERAEGTLGHPGHRRRAWAAGLAAVLGVFIVVATAIISRPWVSKVEGLTRSSSLGDLSPHPGVVVDGQPEGVPPSEPAVAEPTPPPTVTLSSDPSSARVRRGEDILGHTPLEHVAPEAEEQWIIELDGYTPATISIGPDTGKMRVVLERAPKPKAKRPSTTRGRAPGPGLSPL